MSLVRLQGREVVMGYSWETSLIHWTKESASAEVKWSDYALESTVLVAVKMTLVRFLRHSL